MYMKNLMLYTIISIFLFSCGKDDVKNNDEPKLNIKRAIFAPDRILQKKQSSFYIGFRYWKEESLGSKDDVSLTINGISAKLIKQEPNEPLTGENVLFEVYPISSSGDAKVIFTIKNSDKVYVEERILRIVDDFSLMTIWDKLDYDYVRKISYFTEVYQNGSFSMPGSESNYADAQVFGIGEYRADYSAFRPMVTKAFIPGINGVYTLVYETKLLKQIVIGIGSKNLYPSFDKNSTFNELESLYGTPTITYSPHITRTYQSSVFDIAVTDNQGSVNAFIIKAR